MNKPIIIDGVDVSECQYFQFEDDEYTCKAEEGCECAVVVCRSYSDCYYKQLQRVISENEKLLKKLQYKYEEIDAKGFLLMGEDLNFWKNLETENEKLKKEVSDLKFYINSYKIIWEINKKEQYKQVLEEIRDCINVLSTVDNDFKGSMVEWKINKILNEVLEDE